MNAYNKIKVFNDYIQKPSQKGFMVEAIMQMIIAPLVPALS